MSLYVDHFHNSAPKAAAPQVLVAYPGAGEETEQDIFLLLRPETNNCTVESIVLSVFRNAPEYKKEIKIAYLANLPGAFIEHSKLFWRHYATKLFFAQGDKGALSADMRQAFEKFFGVPVAEAEVVGGFAALEKLSYNPEELFFADSAPEDTLRVSGQSIRRMRRAGGKDLFVVNHDIPALLLRGYAAENCAVILFRTSLPYAAFNRYICQTYARLKARGIVKAPPEMTYEEGTKKVFRYSRGPFEQLRDALEFLYDQQGRSVPLADMTFARYLARRGVSQDTMLKLLAFPVGHFSSADTSGGGAQREESTIFEKTKYQNYAQAFDAIAQLQDQRLTILKQ